MEEDKLQETNIRSIEKAPDIPLFIGKLNLNAGHTTEVTRNHPDIQQSEYFTLYKLESTGEKHSSINVKKFLDTQDINNQEKVDIIIELAGGEISNRLNSINTGANLVISADEDSKVQHLENMEADAEKIAYDTCTTKMMIEKIESDKIPHNSKSEKFLFLKENLSSFPIIEESYSSDEIKINIDAWIQGEIEKVRSNLADLDSRLRDSRHQ